mmetsp:Transcript_2673/g.4547  ORF Transcript_2673/g.4547 Transcript_2673/m.4547 type:complete len:187 (+) Transcript_2673:1-561(+)
MESTLVINNSVHGHNNDKDKVAVKKKHLSSLLSFLHPGQGKEELSKVAFTTRAEKCTDTNFLPPLDFTADVFKGQLKSQDHEDETLLDNFFGGLCSGTYLEMGGLDGVSFSNTHVFNKVLGWNGVLVELGPKNFAAFYRRIAQMKLPTLMQAFVTRRKHYITSSMRRWEEFGSFRLNHSETNGGRT